jgi:hypothetical protein
VHAVVQQSPSTQNPLPHWSVAPQLSPGPRFTVQTPAEQNCAPSQSASALQSPRQVSAPQAYGAQLWVCFAGQAPAPLHEASRVAMPLPQLPARQTLEASG